MALLCSKLGFCGKLNKFLIQGRTCLHQLYIAIYFYSLAYSIEKEIEEMFKHLNKAVTDDITFNEVKIYVQETKKDKIDALLNYSLKYCNVDENGIICFNEIFNKIRLVDNAADVECLFKIFDHNSDRFLNAGELRNVINFIMHWNISRKEASCLIKDVIGYKKYKINNEELLRIIKRLKNV